MPAWDSSRAICSAQGFDAQVWRRGTSQLENRCSRSAYPEGWILDGPRSVQASGRSRWYIQRSLRELFPGYRECWPGNSEPQPRWDLSGERLRNRTERGHLRPIDEMQPPDWYDPPGAQDLLR